ncbi:hypothetical protein BU24DRAFT_415765 [Aaosphaeria arxii CBS 175.79]|uniref:Inhibitor I9 domain-containing protein n=1 Tax=Aaosphaeria arxii CBS 175.79 TaxID=1450172 RepID=A0A6A5X730_9PLEO|nr:uncharacterized protein BU24DRAFT_415765 [Aaosphaeria arxii CBS 175.79]KAF2008711.1 hypothetical protein BU24DRAFT_415765 [Aaosphaeria arxii CBS 175.79]
MMATPSRFGWSSLTAIFLLFLSLLNIATATPLPVDDVGKTLVARQTSISESRYQKYLINYFPIPNGYIFYSGQSEDQVKNFLARNRGYASYDTMFNAPDFNHPWYKAFDETKDVDDAEASSSAMASVATGEVLVFGAIEWQTEGAKSFFTQFEIPRLHHGLQTRRITAIKHMVYGATSASQVMAYENASGQFTWSPGYGPGSKNASGAYGVCRRARVGICDYPRLLRKAVRPAAKPKKGGRRY